MVLKNDLLNKEKLTSSRVNRLVFWFYPDFWRE